MWQLDLHREISARLPASVRADLNGSARTPALLDGWSDLDLDLSLDRDVALAEVIGAEAVWAKDSAADGSVHRLIFSDGRRLDLSVHGPGGIAVPAHTDAHAFRFVAGMAAVKLGRGDRLIGTHLVLDLLRRCLVQAMLLRDRDTGTSVHRVGTDHDRLAAEVWRLAALPVDLVPRPNVVERAAALYDRWYGQLEPGYLPDRSGLDALIERGLTAAEHRHHPNPR